MRMQDSQLVHAAPDGPPEGTFPLEKALPLPQIISEDGDSPTEEEFETLRRVTDKIPLAIFLVAVAEVAERFAYRCLTGPLQNYIQNPFHDTGRPGALGLGQARATALGYFFSFWCYLTPILGAIVADSWFGRFKTILAGVVIATTGITILFLTSLPISLEHGAGLSGLVIALIVVGLGTGGIKSDVGPLIAEQYSDTRPRIKTLKDGERVIVDPDITIQTIFSRYYWVINIGASSGLVATWVELKVGFWAAFLISLCVYACTVVTLTFGRNKYIIRPPQVSIILWAFRAFWIGIKNRGNMDRAKPSYMIQEHGQSNVPWDDHFVEELKVALVACRVFAIFPIFWTCYGQTSGNIVSQAARMNTYGLPNDFLGSINPITVLVLIPLLDRWVYPALRHYKIPFRPVTRITIGFFIMAGGIAFAAGTQHMVDTSPPETVSVFWIIPIYVLTGASEIFAFLSSIEFAYTKAPPSMKSIISSINPLSCSIGNALGFALSPTSVQSKVKVEFAALSGTMFLATIVFYVIFSKYNKEEEEMNRLERNGVTDSNGTGNQTTDV